MTWIDKDTERELRREIPLAREELAQIHREAVRRLRKDEYFWLLLILVCPLPVAIIVLMRAAMPWAGASPILRLVRFAVSVVLLAGVVLALFRRLRPRYQHHLRGVVRQRGHEICLNCGYWLEGLGSDIDHCPECGAKRQPLRDPESVNDDEGHSKV